MNGAEYIVESLIDHGVDTVFGYPGGCIMPLYDALPGKPLRHILCRHEQGSAFAANGYARSTGRIGVCIATSGPGATNLITGLADAKMDSVPMIALTGQVPSGLIGTDAFQEIDILGMTLAITKQSYQVERIEDLPAILEEAFQLATEGRPGPILIDLPKDIQLADLPSPRPIVETQPEPIETPSIDNLEIAKEMMRTAKQPLIYAGGGIGHANAITEFRSFVDITGIPTVFSLKGLGALPANHPLNLGMLGMHGSQAANGLVQECDLLIAVGTRFDDRVTGKLARFAPNAQVIHLDIDAAEIGKLRSANCPIRGNIRYSMAHLNVTPKIEPWRQHCQEQSHLLGFQSPSQEDQLTGPGLLQQLQQIAPEDSIICCDVGQHQMWVAQHYPIHHPRQHLTSGGLGAMGFGLPAAIGAQLANPEQWVINIAGDGSFMMNLQELATLKRYQLPVKIIILDNSGLGMVRQQQDVCYEGRYSEIDLSDNPDFCQVAESFGLAAFSADSPANLDTTLQQFLNAPGAALLHVKIANTDSVWPMVKPGDANDQMITGDAA